MGVCDLVFLILVLIIGMVMMMLKMGGDVFVEVGNLFMILGVFENIIVGILLVMGGLVSFIVFMFCLLICCYIFVSNYIKVYGMGVKMMFGVILIFFFVWIINGVVSDM